MDLPRGFYGVTDEKYGSIESAEKLIEFGAKIIQYRCKYKSDRAKYEEAKKIKDMIGKKDIVYIIDDRVDLALMAGSDGVHLGDKDLPVCEVRKIVPDNFIIGLSTHSVEDVLRVKCCDYIGVGPVFYTKTKDDVRAPISVGTAKEMVDCANLPTYLIGGIKLENIEQIRYIKSYGFVSVSDVLLNDKKHFEEMVAIWNS
jgi:thiamine-phosphate pyrophosphorylase